MANTLFEKIREKHVVTDVEGGPSLLYIDKDFIYGNDNIDYLFNMKKEIEAFEAAFA